MIHKHAVVIAAKPPIPGKVKTRLSPPLSLDQSAQLYECFLVDTINTVAAIKKIDRFIAFYPEVSTKDLSFANLNNFTRVENSDVAAKTTSDSLYGYCITSGLSQNDLLTDFTLIIQKGINLGERLISVFEQLFSSGYDSVTIIGSDSPNLPVAFIKSSLNNLKKSNVDVTLGPCKDGGYYLIGLKACYGDIFKEISWSTSSVFDETIEKIKKLGLGVSVLPEWYDIDNNKDLNFLKDEIFSSPKEVAPKTRDFLCFSNFS
jgi:rSAM/selenodomain-associated transferase 1